MKEWNHQIIFLHKILPGSAEKSYGIQVARLAGLPEEVIHRAREVLLVLEAGQPDSVTVEEESPDEGKGKATKRQKAGKSKPDLGEQMSLFG